MSQQRKLTPPMTAHWPSTGLRDSRQGKILEARGLQTASNTVQNNPAE